MILGITERYGLDSDCMERYYIGKQFKEIFEKLKVLLFPISSLTELNKVVDICDGLVITGSAIDINPINYNEQPIAPIDNKSEEIDTLDFELIKAFTKAEKKILGICRGIQAINVYFGGSLYQDMEGHKLPLEQRHNMNIKKDSFLYKCYNKENIQVNSTHHQAIKDVAKGFKVTAVSDDGFVEGIEKGNIIGIQWHPEMMEDIKFFESFLKIV